MSASSIIELSGVVKDYKGLRPLRIDELVIAAGDRTALLGVDQFSAEVLINLITGTTLPDRGTVRVFGQSTADLHDSTEWMTLVDRLGILSDRAVLLDTMSALQNLAIPFSLDVEPPSEDVRSRAVALAREVGLPEASWDARVSELDPLARTTIRLGRALAFSPEVLLLDHPSASVARAEVGVLARQVRRVAEGRAMAALALTADRDFADAMASRVLTLGPSSGRVQEARPGWLARLRLGT